MDFDGFLRHAKLTADLLIKHPSSNQLHHFELARRQQIKQTTSFIPFRCAASLLGRSMQSILNALQEILGFEWFGKKINSSCLHHLSAHGDVSVAGNKNKLLFPAALN